MILHLQTWDFGLRQGVISIPVYLSNLVQMVDFPDSQNPLDTMFVFAAVVVVLFLVFVSSLDPPAQEFVWIFDPKPL